MAFKTGGRKPMTYQWQIRDGIETPAALTGTLQLTDSSSNFLRLDGGAADRELRFPASNRDGVIFRITNVGATNNILLRDSTGAAISGVTTALAPSEGAWVVNENGTWKHMGIEAITL